MNAAVIVDSRKIDVSIIKDHMDHLSGYDLHIWSNHAPENTAHYFHTYVGGGGPDYNSFITRPSFWKELCDYDNVVVFQQDSMILRGGIEYFEGFDYVGAPWKFGVPWGRSDRAGGNGGLSLRNPKAHYDLTIKKPYSGKYGNEDVYFSHYLPSVAPFEVCSLFSCETVFKLGTLGYHAIEKHLSVNEVNRIKYQYY